MKRVLFGLFCVFVTISTSLVIAQQQSTGKIADNNTQASQNAVSKGQAALDRAAEADKYLFILFQKEKDSKSDNAWSMLQAYAAKFADKANVVALQVTDPAEKTIVDRFGVSRAPMPLVLAVAPCGAVTKGFTEKVSKEQLETAFVSPGTQLCLKGLQKGNLVFVCLVDQIKPDGKATIPQAVQDFQSDKRFSKATDIVFIKATDKGEAGFLKDIQVGTKAGLYVLLAPPGSKIGTFNEYSSKETIIESLAAAQSSPCAGGKCGPNGCAPKQ